MSLTGAVVVFLTSLTALPISYILNTVSHWKDQMLILITGLLSFCIVIGIPWVILRKKLQKVDPTYYVLTLLTFSSVLSLVIALENDGLIAEFMGYYLREGEPYLKTAHGTMISYWDGTAHYAIYLMMLAAISWNQTFYDVGLYWVGSFGYGKLVLVLAVIMGKDGLRWPFLLHFPLIIICVWLASRFLKEKQEEGKMLQKEIKERLRNSERGELTIWQRPGDLALVIYYLFASWFIIFRFAAAMEGNVAAAKSYSTRIEPYLTDPLPYAKAQLMVNAFYFIPFNLLNVYALLWPGQTWVPGWSLIMAGAAGQGQFSFIGSSFHYRTPYIHRLPQNAMARTIFWIINGLLFAVPQIAAYRCLSEPNFFLQAQQEETPAETNQVVGNGVPSVGNDNKKND